MKQVWLITGSSQGLGRRIAEAVLENGHQLVATARDPDHLADLEEKYGQNVLVLPLDVTDEAAAVKAVESAVSHFGRLDILANAAGYGNVNSIEETSMADFRAEIETNLFGTIIMSKAVIPVMRVQKSGHIILFSSLGGRMGPAGRGPYAAAKWGVEGFSEVLSKEMAPLGVKVTIIEPGGFRTEFAGASSSLKEGMPEYDTTVGAAARFQRNYHGNQPGDPVRAAKVILGIAGLPEPPLRLLLGTDAATYAEQADLAKLEADKRWRHLSISTDFPAES